jgi:vacuolar protein sorting-associated protein 72
MKSMLAAEEPDDDLELLFAEDDNDQGFSDGGADGSDVHMDSSSDDEDNNAAGADDLEGEKELEKKEKEKKRAAQRKRKAQDAHIPAKFRKKVRINTDAPPPRPKKKSERASWLPSVADAPTRASARSTTRMSKEQLHTQMVEREERRLKQVAQMEKKAAKLAASRKPPMTQEERLIEAEKVEQRNKGSLNRWEEAEKAREEDRLRKLKALTERSLEGPVISFWSGVREGQVRYVEMEEKPVRKKREKPAKGKTGEKKDGEDGATPKPDANTGAEKPVDETADTDKGTPAATNGTKPEIASTEGGDTAPEKPGSKPPEPANGRADSIKALEGEDSKDVSTAASPVPTAEATDSPAEATTTALAEDKDSTAEKPAVDPPLPQEGSKDTKEQPADAAAAATPASEPSNEQLVETAAPSNPETKSASAPVVPDLTTSATTASADIPPSAVVPAPDTVNTSTSQPQPSDQPSKDSSIPPPIDISTKETATSAPQSEVPTPKPEQADETTSTGVTERAPRNAIIFQNFNENVIKDKSIQTQILFGQKMAKLASKLPCPLLSCPVFSNALFRHVD